MDSLNKIYLNQLGSELLSPSEEKELGFKAKNGDKDAFNKLVECNLKFVIKIAGQYQNKGLPFDDLVAEGNLGLIKAVEKYDPSRSNRFITFASFTIKQAIQSALRKNRYMIKFSDEQIRKLERINQVYAMSSNIKNPVERLNYVSEVVGLDLSEINELLRLAQDHLSIESGLESCDNTEGDNESYFSANAFESPESLEDSVSEKFLADDLEKSFSNVLDLREINVLHRHYGMKGYEPQSFSEIAKSYGKTKAWAHQMEQKAFKKLQREEDLEYYLAS